MASALKIQKVTPILVVDDIGPCLSFWTGLGFEKTVDVPGFALLIKDGIEVMYQSRDSVAADLPAAGRMTKSLVYMEVSSLAPIIAAAKPDDVVVPRRTTSYGADEIFVREPGGHVVGFAVQSQ